MSQKIQSFDVLGIPISVVTLDSAATYIEQWAKDLRGRFVCVREVPSLMASLESEELVSLHKRASMVTPDGMPLVWIGRARGFKVSRTCGPDLMDLVLSRSPNSNLRHYFYGGQEGIAKKLAERFTSKYPGCQIVGWECPPFRQLTETEELEVRHRIIASRADVVWVGISSPKQDLWMARNVDLLSQTLIGVGAAFNFHTGAVRRAPKWMQRSGLEWLHRLCSEPGRLWRRYLILAPKFLIAVCIEGLRKRIRDI